MSTGKRIPLNEAQVIASEIVRILEPHCERIAIAGSIRRQAETVGDIEIVCIPKSEAEAGLFGSVNVRSKSFGKAVFGLGFKSKGDLSEGNYVAIDLYEYDLQLDLFITTPEKWGWIYLLRTGSAEYSARIARKLKTKGYGLMDGYIWKDSTRIPVYTEADVYDLAGMKWIAPKNRNPKKREYKNGWYGVHEPERRSV